MVPAWVQLQLICKCVGDRMHVGNLYNSPIHHPVQLHQLWLHRNYKLCGLVDMLGHLTYIPCSPEAQRELLHRRDITKEFYIQGNNMSITNDAGELRQDNEKYGAPRGHHLTVN